jgi:Rrf2 family nitric oxide-sensitive transcriptional repressor
MRLTGMTDYALRLLMFLGSNPGRLCTIAEVAQAYRISEAHLMKITHLLGTEGWIETLRGKGGGMRLARSPAEINLGAVVRTTESDFRVVECFTAGSPCTLAGNCGLAGIMQGALDSFLQHLDAHTLADILPPSSGGALPSNVRVVNLERERAARSTRKRG